MMSSEENESMKTLHYKPKIKKISANPRDPRK